MAITTFLFLLTRWPPVDRIARLLRYEHGHHNGQHHHERTEHERRSRRQLRVLLHRVDRLVADGGRIGHRLRGALRVVVQVDVEQVEDDAEHGGAEAVAKAAHAGDHALGDACVRSWVCVWDGF